MHPNIIIFEERNDDHLRMSKTYIWLATGLMLTMALSPITVVVAQHANEIDVMEGVREIKGTTMEKCAKACANENAIKCKYFKFVKGTKSCFLSESKHPGTSSRRAEMQRGPTHSLLEHEVEEMWQDMRSFQASSKNFEKFEKAVMKELESRAREIQTLKESGIKDNIDISHLKRMVNSLVSNSHQLAGGIGDLQASQKNLRNQVSDIRRTNGKMVSGMSKLDIRTQELGGKLDSIGMTNIEMIRKLNNFQEDYMKLQRNVENLIGDRTGTVEVIKKVNQLSQAQITLNDIVIDLKDRQDSSQNLLKDIEGYTKRLAEAIKTEERQQMDVGRKMEGMQSANKELERQLKTLKTTESKVDNKLQSEVENLLNKLVYQSDKSKDLQEQSSMGKQRIHTLHTALQKMAQLHSNLKTKLDNFLKNSTRVMERINQKTILEADDITDLRTKQKKLFHRLQKLVKDGEQLSTEMKQFPRQLGQVSKQIRHANKEGNTLSAKVKNLEGAAAGIETNIKTLASSLQKQKIDFPKEAINNMKESQTKLSISLKKLEQTQTSTEKEIKAMEREVKHLNKTASVKTDMLKDIASIKMENAMIAQLALEAVRSKDGDGMSIDNKQRLQDNVERALIENEMADLNNEVAKKHKHKHKHKKHRKHTVIKKRSVPRGKKTNRAAKRKNKSKGRKVWKQKDELTVREVSKSSSKKQKIRRKEKHRKSQKSNKSNRRRKLSRQRLDDNLKVDRATMREAE